MTINEKETGENLNFNISAYRVLFILLLLTQHRALDQMELNNYLWENPLINRTYNKETVTKYMNTLRRVGCKILRPTTRNDFKYELAKNPLPLIFGEEMLNTAQQLLWVLASQPDEELHIQYHGILQKLSWAMTDAQQERLLSENPLAMAPPAIQQRRELLKRYRKVCQDAYAVEIHYKTDGSGAEAITLEPLEVVQESYQAFLLGVDRQHQKVKLNLEHILQVRQLPSKVQQQVKYVNILFKLTGRLAKTYRLYPEETLLSQTAEAVTIKAKTSDYHVLLRRLLKYNAHCEVISPTYVREELQQRIQILLETLSQPLSCSLDQSAKLFSP